MQKFFGSITHIRVILCYNERFREKIYSIYIYIYIYIYTNLSDREEHGSYGLFLAGYDLSVSENSSAMSTSSKQKGAISTREISWMPKID